MCRSFLAVAIALSIRPGLGQNIYPDPGFEASGMAGVKRTGEKAGHLKVDQVQHWVALGGPVRVEPFATYRASAWVKARAGTGLSMALYCYGWNSFDWAYVRNVPLQETQE